MHRMVLKKYKSNNGKLKHVSTKDALARAPIVVGGDRGLKEIV